MEQSKINRDSFEPAYIQLINILRELISRGIYRSGDRLPSESQLCKEYQVSPMTVRRAINTLIEQGVVSTAQGKGTFVKPLQLSTVTFGLDQLQALLSGETETQVKILQVRIVKADEAVSSKLSMPVGTRTIHIERLLSRNGEPWIFHREYLIYDPRRPVVETEMEVASLYGLFSRGNHSDFKFGKLSIVASVLSDTDARLLQSAPGKPAFVLEHLFYDFDYTPVSWGWFVCRGDRVSFSSTVGHWGTP